jgi:hypothetical protein
MEPEEHVQVRGHHAELEKSSPFLPNDDFQVLRQVRCPMRIDVWQAPPSGPDHVEMEVVVHVQGSVAGQYAEYPFNARPVALATPAEPSLQRRAESIRCGKRTSRAAALATRGL